MVNVPPDEPAEQLPVNEIPIHYMNGFQGWHIVIGDEGEEIIELVSSDEELDAVPAHSPEPPVDVSSDEEPDLVPGPPPVPPAANVIEEPAAVSPVPLEENEEVLDAVEIIDIGVQVDILELAYYSGRNDSSDTESNENDMEVDDDDYGVEKDILFGDDHRHLSHCLSCGKYLPGGMYKERRSHRFYGAQYFLYIFFLYIFFFFFFFFNIIIYYFFFFFFFV